MSPAEPPIDQFKNYNYDPRNPNKTIEITAVDAVRPEIALKLYAFMVRLRRCEELLLAEYHPADEIRCPVHFCIGEEVLPAALNLALAPEDFVFSHHRSHGFYLARVPSMNALFAEMYGKVSGDNGGISGSQEVSVKDHHFYSGAILAGMFPIAAGTALAMQLKKEPHCVVAAAGDAASDEGVYWEAINYAALKKLPILFLCENNYYSTFSPQHKRNSTCNIAERARAFGVESKSFFGNDPIKAYLEVHDALESIRKGKGPVFLESFTYRWNGHVGPDSDDKNNYRPAEELAYWKKHCPIGALEKKLLQAGLLTESKRAEIYHNAEAEVARAFQFAKASPFPEVTDLAKLNFSNRSPLADRLLKNEQQLRFNQNQSEVLPGPY